MPRPSKTRRLVVWMNGEAVGTWMLGSHGQHAFAYHDAWMASPRARPLSLSMPLRPADVLYRGEVVEAFFDNLLPDSREIRQHLKSRFRVASTRAFDLLAEVGRDCVGAVQLLPEDDLPRDWKRINGKKLNEAGVAAILRATPLAAADDADAFRISLAGAQEKTALLWHDDAWYRPSGTTPTTHIFKLPLGQVGNLRIDLGTSVENEWLCSRLVRAYGLAVAECNMGTFEDQGVLVVRRFDRRPSADGKYLLRLPQEDMCQALGVPPSLKYEADGGPGIKPIMDLLLGSAQAEKDRLTFFKAQIVFWMLCATDGHAKNFSIAIKPQGRYQLAPLYDVISAWPVLGNSANRLPRQKVKMAMAAMSRNRHYRWADIQPRHWLSTAHACGIDQDAARKIMRDLQEATPTIIARVGADLPDGFPTDVSESILHGLEVSAGKLGTGKI